MAYFYDPVDKKAYKVLDYNENSKSTKYKNPTLYVQTRPGYQKRVSALRMSGVKEDPDTKKWNDNVFKALSAFKKKK